MLKRPNARLPALASIFLSSLLDAPGFAATVTVDRGSPQVPGVNYHEVSSAVGNFRKVDVWGNGSGDTVLISQGSYRIANELLPGFVTNNDVDEAVPGGDGTLTLRAAPGATPIIALDPMNPGVQFFYFKKQGRYILEGLTFVGPEGQPNIMGGTNRACLAADPFQMEGVAIRLEVRNCVFTKNNGSDGAVMDFTGSPPDNSTPGVLQRILYVGDNQSVGTLDVLFEDCVIAYSNHTEAIRIDRNVDDPALDARSFTFRNVLFASNRTRPLRVTSAYATAAFTFEKCCFINSPGELARFTDTQAGPSVRFSDCIFSSLPAGGASGIRLEGGGFLNLVVERCTFHGGAADAIHFHGPVGPLLGQDTLVLRDLIDVNGNASLLRYQPSASELPPGGQPVSLSVEAIASDGATPGDSHLSIETTFSSLYGGTGPISDVPLSDFVSTSFDSATFADIRAWDPESNDFFDIAQHAAPKYRDMGSAGADLTGGGQCVGCDAIDPTPTATPNPTPTPNPSGIENWMLYAD